MFPFEVPHSSPYCTLALCGHSGTPPMSRGQLSIPEDQYLDLMEKYSFNTVPFRVPGDWVTVSTKDIHCSSTATHTIQLPSGRCAYATVGKFLMFTEEAPSSPLRVVSRLGECVVEEGSLPLGMKAPREANVGSKRMRDQYEPARHTPLDEPARPSPAKEQALPARPDSPPTRLNLRLTDTPISTYRPNEPKPAPAPSHSPLTSPQQSTASATASASDNEIAIDSVVEMISEWNNQSRGVMSALCSEPQVLTPLSNSDAPVRSMEVWWSSADENTAHLGYLSALMNAPPLEAATHIVKGKLYAKEVYGLQNGPLANHRMRYLVRSRCTTDINPRNPLSSVHYIYCCYHGRRRGSCRECRGYVPCRRHYAFPSACPEGCSDKLTCQHGVRPSRCRECT